MAEVAEMTKRAAAVRAAAKRAAADAESAAADTELAAADPEIAAVELAASTLRYHARAFWVRNARCGALEGVRFLLFGAFRFVTNP